MTPQEFVIAKFGKLHISLNDFHGYELAELIKEYLEVQWHIKNSGATLDGRTVNIKEWIDYNEQYNDWKSRIGEFPSLDDAMSKPNKPNYYRANND